MLGSGSKLFRYKEFTIPFVVYREGELSRDDFLDLMGEIKEIQREQHDALLESLKNDDDLRKNHGKIHDNLTEAARLFDEAVELTIQALEGPEDDEDDLLEDALETFKKGNLLLADAYYDLDEMWERSDIQGSL